MPRRWVTEVDNKRRTGLACNDTRERRGRSTVIKVRLGTDGPFRWLSTRRLRDATTEEIAEREGTLTPKQRERLDDDQMRRL